MASIFAGRKGRQVIYPQLRRLTINRREAMSWHKCKLQLLLNPTPMLTELHCNGQFPFDSVQLITWNRQQLQALSLDLDVKLMKQLYKTGDFYAEAFPKLKALSLGWNPTNVILEQRAKSIIFAMLFTLGCSVEYVETSIALGRVYLEIFQDVCMDSIVYIDMRAISITCLQAVRMFGRLRQLSCAHFSLTSCRQDGRWRMMTAGELCYYKSNREESSSVRSLYIHNDVFQESEFVPAHVLAFALALPSLRFIIAPMRSRDIDIDMLIAQTRQGSLFCDEPQVNNVKLLNMY
ncbi:hypothetical protein EC988_008606 [Linderina pennispora]|nr:hypothetical protein EC988_008606 [Linderina pennispora]